MMQARKLSPDPEDLDEGEQPEDEPIGDWSTEINARSHQAAA